MSIFRIISLVSLLILSTAGGLLGGAHAAQTQLTIYGANEDSDASSPVGTPFSISFQYDDDLPLTASREMSRTWSGSTSGTLAIGGTSYGFDTIKIVTILQENGSQWFTLTGSQSDNPDLSWSFRGSGGDLSSFSWMAQPTGTNLQSFEQWSGAIKLSQNFVAGTPCGAMAAGLAGPASPNRCPIAVDAKPPTDTQLMTLAADSYDLRDLSPADTFQRIADGTVGDHSLGSTFAEAFVAKGVAGGTDQVVVAIRGSSVMDYLNRDGTFASGEATDAYQASARDVAGLLAKLHQEYPNAHFTLTGHSLGGAIAQSLGDVLDIKAVGFDAPGAKGVLDENAMTSLRDIANAGPNGDIVSDNDDIYTVRYYGDVISNLGNDFGDVRTVSPSGPELEAIQQGNETLPGACIYSCHDRNALLTALLQGAPEEAGIPDPLSRFNGVTTILVPTVGAVKIVLQVFSSGQFWIIDPAGPGQYIRIDMLDSDVVADGLFLPGWGSFDIYGSNGSDWNLIGQAQGFEAFDLPQFSSYLISNAGTLKGPDGGFDIGLRFAEDGTFRGQLSAVDLPSVPEPSVWVMMIVGFAAVGALTRRKADVRAPVRN